MNGEGEEGRCRSPETVRPNGALGVQTGVGWGVWTTEDALFKKGGALGKGRGVASFRTARRCLGGATETEGQRGRCENAAFF